MNSQACWFLAEGAFMAASRMRSTLSFSTLPGMKSLTLTLVNSSFIISLDGNRGKAG